jgi:hypothetical protein
MHEHKHTYAHNVGPTYPHGRPTGRGEVAAKRAPRKPAAQAIADKPRRPAPKRKAEEAGIAEEKEVSVCLCELRGAC